MLPNKNLETDGLSEDAEREEAMREMQASLARLAEVTDTAPPKRGRALAAAIAATSGGDANKPTTRTVDLAGVKHHALAVDYKDHPLAKYFDTAKAIIELGMVDSEHEVNEIQGGVMMSFFGTLFTLMNRKYPGDVVCARFMDGINRLSDIAANGGNVLIETYLPAYDFSVIYDLMVDSRVKAYAASTATVAGKPLVIEGEFKIPGYNGQLPNHICYAGKPTETEHTVGKLKVYRFDGMRSDFKKNAIWGVLRELSPSLYHVVRRGGGVKLYITSNFNFAISASVLDAIDPSDEIMQFYASDRIKLSPKYTAYLINDK